MKLYLSSYRLGNHPEALHALAPPGARAALIFNALDRYGSDRLRNYERESSALEALGFTCEELDLRRHKDNAATLREELAKVQLIWAVGGSTTRLARAMHSARFGEIAADLLHRDELVYAGYSAGACVTGPDLQGITLMEAADDFDPSPAPTLGWIDVRIVPHWRSDHHETALADRAVAHLERERLAFQRLRDGEALLVDGDRVEIV